MEIRQLRYFIAVAEELHFGRAAARLHMSQAPLSTAIQKLEKEIGHALFERTTRSVSLTAVGRELYRRATDIFSRIDDALETLDRVAQGQVGTLRVGYVSSVSYSILPQAVRNFREVAPDVDLHLVPASSGDQIKMLEEEQLDVGIVRGQPSNTGALDLRLIYEEHLVACLPQDHRLATQETVSPSDLSNEPLIFFRARDMSGYTAEFNAFFSPGPLPLVHTHVVHQETALGFIAAGLGFTLLPESVSTFTPNAVKIVPLNPPAPTTVRIAIPLDRGIPAAAIFRKLLIESSKKHRVKARLLG